eukprot:s2110_g7.t1
MLNAFQPYLEHHLIGHLIVALVVSALSCLMLISLDKVADTLKAGGDAESAVHIIQHIILAHGLLIGISWEVCFALGMHAIGHAMQGPNVDVYLAVFLCLVVVPAYRALGRCLEGSSPLPQAFLLCCGFGQYSMSASLSVGLSFSVATMAKSAKMVPVMIGSLLLGSKTFSSSQISQAAAIVLGTGIVSFAEGRNKKSGASTKLGIFFIMSSLFCDGLVSGLQQRLKERCKAEKTKVRSYDLMFWTNLYMAVASFLFAVARSEMREGIRFCLQNPLLARKILKFALCGALGQACIFYTIANFDSVVCSALTSTRKLLSVMISVLEGDGLPYFGWIGVVVASVGITGEIGSDRHRKK